MNGILDAALGHQHILVDMGQGALVDAGIEHGVRVGTIIGANLGQKLMHFRRILGGIVGHALEIL